MDDLIRREDALGCFHDWIDKYGNVYTPDDMLEYRAIEQLPSAQERKKGRWVHDGYDIPHGVDWIHCSVCGRRAPNVPAARTPYCPNCGAEMRGEEE